MRSAVGGPASHYPGRKLQLALCAGTTSQLPMWLAPNLITLLGIFGLIIAYVLTALYIPGFDGIAPAWVYWFNGLAVLTYLHLDCIDGKQARRTGTSSPLGQLFDHGESTEQ